MKGFYFDANGEFETENPVLVKVMAQTFKIKEDAPVPVKTRLCHKCGFEAENHAAMMAHYREKHPPKSKKR